VGNEQHNPGEPLHWAREKSTDQMNTAFRHQLDYATGVKKDTDGQWHLAKAIWRLSAQLQLDIEAEERETTEEIEIGLTPGDWVGVEHQTDGLCAAVTSRDGVSLNNISHPTTFYVGDRVRIDDLNGAAWDDDKLGAVGEVVQIDNRNAPYFLIDVKVGSGQRWFAPNQLSLLPQPDERIDPDGNAYLMPGDTARVLVDCDYRVVNYHGETGVVQQNEVPGLVTLQFKDGARRRYTNSELRLAAIGRP
jgi:hypothetical protein